MRKKILLMVLTIFMGTFFIDRVNADTSCKYIGTNSNGILTLKFNVNDDYNIEGDPIVDGYTTSSDDTYIDAEAEAIDNWKKTQHGESLSGKEYFEKNKKCPPKAIWIDREKGFVSFGTDKYTIYVGIEEDMGKFELFAMEKQGYEILNLVNPNIVGKKFTINFIKNSEEATGSMSSISGTYGQPLYIPESGFTLYGFDLIGYRVKNNGKWWCTDGYKASCDRGKYRLVASANSTLIDFDPNNTIIELYAQWEPKSNVNSQAINHYNLGKDFCMGRGYIWVESNGGYCNTDKLQYVTCGDSYDIPVELPRIISYLVNLLKIVTPLLLIFISMITLVKAVVASKEDEMKKAQASLVKKIVSAVMVFFVVSIVQFVIMKVADSGETASISNCMSCFLNNDCVDTTYYKTNMGGKYYCTKVTEKGREDIVSCIDFYNDIKAKF